MSSERESTGGGAAVVVDPLGGLVLDPANELVFRGPFDDYVSVSLTIRNPTSKRVAFKIKTTAPKRYCVKPNSGVLDSEQSMKVNVLLQPFIFDPNEKNKHKFMVQYMYLNENEMQYSVNDILNMWKDVPVTRLLDLKLKCVFILSESDQQRIEQQQQSKLANETKTAAATTAATEQKSEVKSGIKSSSSSNASSTSFASSSVKDNFVAAASDFDSKPITATSPVTTTSSSSRLDKHDNTLNELKLLKQENESLRREIARLKDEETRLRKLALQAPSSTLNKTQSGADALTDFLNNRSTLIIIVLLAIVVYLLLFR